MFKSIVIIFFLAITQLMAKELVLNSDEQQALQNIGVNIVNIASINQGYVEDKNIKSTIVLAKIVLDSNFTKTNIYDPFTNSKIVYNGKSRNAILIITGNKAQAVVEHYSNYQETIGSVYPFKIQFFSAKKLSDFLPKTIKTKEGIILPTGAGIDTYLFWNGKKFVLVMTDEIP